MSLYEGRGDVISTATSKSGKRFHGIFSGPKRREQSSQSMVHWYVQNIFSLPPLFTHTHTYARSCLMVVICHVFRISTTPNLISSTFDIITEFWEDHFQCRYPNSSLTPYNEKYTRLCTTKEQLTRNDTVFEAQLQFVSDAVMAFAYALK